MPWPSWRWMLQTAALASSRLVSLAYLSVRVWPHQIQNLWAPRPFSTSLFATGPSAPSNIPNNLPMMFFMTPIKGRLCESWWLPVLFTALGCVQILFFRDEWMRKVKTLPVDTDRLDLYRPGFKVPLFWGLADLVKAQQCLRGSPSVCKNRWNAAYFKTLCNKSLNK